LAVLRDDPYRSFNLLVTNPPESGGDFRGGFSDSSDINTEINDPEYRDGLKLTIKQVIFP
jgi:hypothetical protein